MDIREYKKLGKKLKKRNKYNAVGVWVCSECATKLKRLSACSICGDKAVYFHSTGEYKHWLKLRSMERLKLISDLKRQVRFSLDVNNVHVANYRADFSYLDKENKLIVEDFKGQDTYASKLARKLTLAIHGVDVQIVK